MHIAIMLLNRISIYSGITAGPHPAASAGKVVLFSWRLRLKPEPNSPLPSATLSRQPCGGSLWQTHTHKHLYTHNKTTRWTLLGTGRSSVLYLMLSLAVFLRINNSPTLYVPKAFCCCFHHWFSKGTWSFFRKHYYSMFSFPHAWLSTFGESVVCFFSRDWILEYRV